MPTITAVVCSRNDSQDNRRMILALKNMSNLYDEVILVDYGSEVPLHEYLMNQLPQTGKLRCITVSPELVRKLSDSNSDKFVEVWARNIGIRRATSDFIVSTNQDVIIDRPERVPEDTMYTVARYSVPQAHTDTLFAQASAPYLCDIPSSDSPLWYLKGHKNEFQRHPNSTDEQGRATWDPGDVWSLVVSCGDFQLAHRNIWYKIRGFEESLIHRGYADSNIMKKASKFFKIDRIDLSVFHLDHPMNSSYSYQLNDKTACVIQFDETTNPETWGFSDIEIPEVRI